MIDNCIKVVLLTSEVRWDSEVGVMTVEDLHEVFKDYQRLNDLTADNLLGNNEGVCFLEIQNNLFDYFVTRLTLKEGQIKLATRVHVLNDERKIILSLSYKLFLEYVKDYKAVLKQKRDVFIRYLNDNSQELIYLKKLLPNEVKEKKSGE